MKIVSSVMTLPCMRVGILILTACIAAPTSALAESTRLYSTDRYFASSDARRLGCLFRGDEVLPVRQRGRKLELLSRTSSRMAFCRGNIHRITPKIASDGSLCADLNLRRTESDEYVERTRERCVFDRKGKAVTEAFSPFVQVFAYSRNNGTPYGYSFPLACGGTVIARNKVLVPAACLPGNDAFSVRYQTWNGAFRAMYSEDVAVLSDTIEGVLAPVFGVITLPEDLPVPQARVPSKRLSLRRGTKSIAASFDFAATALALDRPTACRVRVDTVTGDGQFLLNGPSARECLLGDTENDFGAVLVAGRRSSDEPNLIQGIFLGSITTTSDGTPQTTNRFYRLDTTAARAFFALHGVNSAPRTFHSSPVGDARVCRDLEETSPETSHPPDLLKFRAYNAATCALAATSPYTYLLVKDQGEIVETCSGVFLDSRTILTAAHCLYKSDGTMNTSVDARFGVELAQSIESTTLIPHPSYDHLSGIRAHDIGIIKLPSDAAISPRSLASSLPVEEEIVYYHGFGAHGAPIASFFPESRKKILGGAQQITRTSDQFFNVLRDGFQTATCRGDSGSPIMVDEGGILKVVGVVSGGSGLYCQAGDIARYINIREPTNLSFITTHLE